MVFNYNFAVHFDQFLVGKIEANWGSPETSQYHIQTDEGPERFFRYQTDNGQFRNERRLKDGTVIGKFILSLLVVTCILYNYLSC